MNLIDLHRESKIKMKNKLDIQRAKKLQSLKALIEQAKATEDRPEALYSAVRNKLQTAIDSLQQAINEYDSPF